MSVVNIPKTINVTGSPQLDSLLRGLIATASGAITVYILGFLNAHGVTTEGYTEIFGAAIFSMLVAIASIVWGIVNAQLTKNANILHVVEAAKTGVIPPAVIAAATTPKQVDAVLSAIIQKGDVNDQTK